jgi:hypothetical protein
MDRATQRHAEEGMIERSPIENLQEAAALFRENETMFGDSKQDKEKANLYRGLAVLAEAMAQLHEQQRRHHETAPT